jgi:hypothetical protein
VCEEYFLAGSDAVYAVVRHIREDTTVQVMGFLSDDCHVLSSISAWFCFRREETGQGCVRNTKLAHQFWFSYPPPGGGSSRSQTDEEKKEKKEAAEAQARAEHAQQVLTGCIRKYICITAESSECLGIVAHLFKARTLEPEKQPLLAIGSDTTFVYRQRFGKHVPAAKDTQEVLLEMVFCTQSVQRGFKQDSWRDRVSTVQESEEMSQRRLVKETEE